MKLPNELRDWFGSGENATVMHQRRLKFAEAIVRDCAKVCEDLHGGPEDYAFAILTRYGLEKE